MKSILTSDRQNSWMPGSKNKLALNFLLSSLLWRPVCDSSFILLRVDEECEIPPGSMSGPNLTFLRKEAILNSKIIKANIKSLILNLNNLFLLINFFYLV